MPNQSKHDPNYTLAQLTLNLQGSEAIRGSVGAIKATSNNLSKFTGADHLYIKPVPQMSLKVLLDPRGDVGAPAGTTLVCRGDAWIEGSQTKVALFR